MSFLSFTPALRRLTGVAVPQAGRCLVGAQARQQRWVARSFSSKVAVIQDQQIPKDEAMKALSGKGFDVSWSLAEPSDAWAIVTVTNPVTKEVLDKHPKCKLVAVSFTGFNHVDLEACKERGISVVNVPAYSTDSVAELSVGLALAVYREIPAGERTLRAGGWVHSSGGMEIRDKVVGIVGLGDIGLRTAELFKAFGPSEILGWSRRPKAAFETLGKQVPIEELFEKSDIVSLHVALNAETQGIIGRSLMERLRPESVLINVARGGVCDQPALADLLCQKRFRAGLDVFATEPIPADDPILKVPADQAVMIPHVAYQVEALRRRMEITATNIKLFADGPDSPRERGDMMRASSIDDAAHQGGPWLDQGNRATWCSMQSEVLADGRQEVRSPPAMSVKIPCGVARSVGDVLTQNQKHNARVRLKGVRRFFETGWEEVETLGRGARGPVVSIRRADGRGPISALKRSTHHEVEALKALSNCRNIVELEEIFLCSGQVLARLECMEGGSFRSYLRARPPGRVSEDVVRYVVGQVLEGLQDMHQSGWMHRDVKAENIGLGCELSSWGYRDCTVKLLDFDVAVEVGCGGLSEVIGTVENMAPEVFKGSYNELADIWSVGIITYEALYGYRPFNDANVDRIEEMVRNWQRYLLFPFDAAELPAHFIRLMLADPEERAAAGTVRHHRWLRPGHIESELPATGSGFPNSYRHHPSSKSEGSKVKLHEANCRSRSVKVSTVKLLEGLRDEPKDEIETSFTEWDQDTALVDDPHLRKSRRSSRPGGLTQWPSSGNLIAPQAGSLHVDQQCGDSVPSDPSCPDGIEAEVLS
ncbi:Glyoxylate reductase [Durusdinium trenchii]|uniref:Glyoxylate reductase n=1 Tax=Durusdinium trenchii TaxID=1381693 RepID=A0ABP0L3I9_9DINO